MAISGELLSSALAGHRFCRLRDDRGRIGGGPRRAVRSRAGGARSWSTASGSRPSTSTPIASFPRRRRSSTTRSRRRGCCGRMSRDRIARDGRSRGRCRGAQHQPLLVPRRARRGGRADPDPEREAGRVLRRASRPLCRLRDGGAAAPRPRRRAARACGQDARACAASSVGGSVAGQELADPKFHPFWAKARSSAS